MRLRIESAAAPAFIDVAPKPARGAAMPNESDEYGAVAALAAAVDSASSPAAEGGH